MIKKHNFFSIVKMYLQLQLFLDQNIFMKFKKVKVLFFEG